MSTTAHRLHRYPQIIDVIEPKPKRQRPPKHARIAVKLDTVMGCAREMGRLIRLSYNGRLPAEELTRYIFALDKLRACLESAAVEANAAQAQANAEPRTVNISVTSVPSGHYLAADGSFQPMSPEMLKLEASSAPEPEKAASHEESALEAELTNLSLEELMVRAPNLLLEELRVRASQCESAAPAAPAPASAPIVETWSDPADDDGSVVVMCPRSRSQVIPPALTQRPPRKPSWE